MRPPAPPVAVGMGKRLDVRGQIVDERVELVLLGIVSLRTGKKLYWDAANMKARGLPEADAFIKEQYRKGWKIV